MGKTQSVASQRLVPIGVTIFQSYHCGMWVCTVMNKGDGHGNFSRLAHTAYTGRL